MTDKAAMSDVAGIVKGLTKAQREAIPMLPVEPAQFLPIGISRVTRERLIAKGLVQRKAPANGFGMVRWWLTDLGLAVRSALIKEKAL